MRRIRLFISLMVLCMVSLGHAQNYDYSQLSEKVFGPLSGETDMSLAKLCQAVESTISDDVTRSRFVADFVLQMYFRYPSPFDCKSEVDSLMRLCVVDSLQKKVSASYDKFYRDYSPIFPGHPAPEITLKDSSGKSLKLSDLRGKMLFVDIWGTWCGPCKDEVPHIAALYEKYKDDGRVEIIGIACDKKFDTWKNYITKHPEPWRQFIVDDEGNKTLDDVYFVYGIPRFMLIGKDGTIISADCNRPSFGDMFAKEFETALSSQ